MCQTRDADRCISEGHVSALLQYLGERHKSITRAIPDKCSNRSIATCNGTRLDPPARMPMCVSTRLAEYCALTVEIATQYSNLLQV